MLLRQGLWPDIIVLEAASGKAKVPLDAGQENPATPHAVHVDETTPLEWRLNMAVNFVSRIDDRVPLQHALISVSDKTGLEDLIHGLLKAAPGLTMYSTGGTYDAIARILDGHSAAPQLTKVSDYTGQPEMQGGLVKTLDFKIYLGLLSETYNPAHTADLERVRAVPIDLVAVNLYPFAETVSRPDATPEHARANIDIGGPCMIRAAAKNYLRVVSLTDPSDIPRLVRELHDHDGATTAATRFDFARKAFAHTAAYDRAIADYLAQRSWSEAQTCYQMTAPDHV